MEITSLPLPPPSLRSRPAGVPALLARCPVLGLRVAMPPGGCPAGSRHTSNPGVGGLPRDLCSLCLKGRIPWGTNTSDEVLYSSPGQEKAGVHSGTDDRRKIAQDILFFLLSIHPTHPRVCPDTSRGADTAVSEVGNLQEEASRLSRTETSKLTPALRSDSAMCHLPGVPSSNVARDTPGCENVLAQPTIFRG